jgi:hypothetical protein
VNLGKSVGEWQARHRKRKALPPPSSGGGITPDAANTGFFHGISQSDCAQCHPGPVAATNANGTQIPETDDDFIKVFNKTGAALCGGGMTLDAFFGVPAGSIAQSQLQYDDVSNQFILTATQRQGAAPAGSFATVYIAATTGHDACGSWNLFTLHVGSSVIGALTTGQDARALLISAQEPDGNSELLAIPKAQLLAGTPLNPATFQVQGPYRPVPVTTAGSPLIDSPQTYFLGADGDTGYRLFTVTGSGTSTPVLTTRLVGAPYSDAGLEFDDFLFTPPVFDGSRIWFTHIVGAHSDVAAITRYGYIKVADGSMTMAQVGADLTPWRLAPSIAVTPNADGTVSVFLDWLSVGVGSPNPVTDMVKSFIYPGSGLLPGSAGSDQDVAASNDDGDQLITDDGDEFDEVSSAVMDPGTADGTCAVTAQATWLADNTWTTLVRRKCGPLAPVPMPSVIGDTQAAAVSAVQAAGLSATVADVTTQTVACNANTAGTIFAQGPAPATSVSAGATVSLSFCDLTTATVPNVARDTPAQAAAALRSAGFTEGSVIGTTNCSLLSNGLILAASPAIGSRQVTGIPINLQECRLFPAVRRLTPAPTSRTLI